MDEVEVKKHLFETDMKFRKLAEKHLEYERQLQELIEKQYFNLQDQFQEKMIKKKKLVVKDQMQMLISRYQLEHSVG